MKYFEEDMIITIPKEAMIGWCKLSIVACNDYHLGVGF